MQSGNTTNWRPGRIEPTLVECVRSLVRCQRTQPSWPSRAGEASQRTETARTRKRIEKAWASCCPVCLLVTQARCQFGPPRPERPLCVCSFVPSHRHRSLASGDDVTLTNWPTGRLANSAAQVAHKPASSPASSGLKQRPTANDEPSKQSRQLIRPAGQAEHKRGERA